MKFFYTLAILLLLPALMQIVFTRSEAELEAAQQANANIMQQNVSLQAEIASLTAQIAEGQEIASGLTLRPLGEFEVTHYSYNSGLTYTETVPQEFKTVAVDKAIIALHSLLYIEGYGWRIAEDTGAFSGKLVDIYVEDYDEAVQLGRLEGVRVWLVERK